MRHVARAAPGKVDGGGFHKGFGKVFRKGVSRAGAGWEAADLRLQAQLALCHPSWMQVEWHMFSRSHLAHGASVGCASTRLFVCSAAVASTSTHTGNAGSTWFQDDVIQLREWASGGVHRLPPVRAVSRQHARLICEQGRWTLTDAGSKNGVLVEGSQCRDVELRPALKSGSARSR
jgi:hypothetical protein